MNRLVVYDSQYGNTEKIARAVGDVLSPCSVKKIGETNSGDITAADLVVIGSPTYGGRPTIPVLNLLNQLPAHALTGKRVAAFDTRVSEKEINTFLKILVKTIGFAAPKIAKMLESKSGKLVAPSVGFTVKGKEGPLHEGELERAQEWAKGILEKV